jgi:hypothetical protein
MLRALERVGSASETRDTMQHVNTALPLLESVWGGGVHAHRKNLRCTVSIELAPSHRPSLIVRHAARFAAAPGE